MGLVGLLIIVRAALPILLKHRINEAINEVEGYHGGVSDVDLQLYRGGFYIQQIQIFEEASKDPSIPMVSLAELDFSIHWRSLFKGKFVGEVYMDSLGVNFIRRTEPQTVDSVDARINLIQQIQQLNPINLNIFQITNGQVAYKDPGANPKIDIALHEFDLRAENLGNVINPKDALPANFKLTATTLDSGSVYLSGGLNYLLNPPNFDYNFKLEKIDMVRFNELFQAYAKLGVSRGELNFYSEGKAINGKLEGYAKPLIVGLEIAPADSSDGLASRINRGLAELGSNIFENKEKEQIGTKIPVEGRITGTDADVLQSIWNFVKNAFIEAYAMKLDQSIGEVDM